MPSSTSTVWITNFAGHDYSDAAEWGDLQYLTKGYVRPDRPDRILYDITTKIAEETSPDDWLLPSGLLLLNIFAGIAWMEKHGTLRLLQFDRKFARSDGRPAYREVIITRSQIDLILKTLMSGGTDDGRYGQEDRRATEG